MYEGGCLCGGVRYELNGELGTIVICHCSRCRKAQGSAFAVNAPVPAARLRLLRGEELLTAYESSPGKFRVFCGRCGSPLFSRNTAMPDVLRLRIGSLDTPLPPTVRPQHHIYASSKAGWYTIGDDLPQHEGVEPGR